MERLRNIELSIINKARQSPSSSGLAFQKFGVHEEIKKYSDREITEMHYGIYKDRGFLCINDYFINVNDVVESVCILEDASYYKQPTLEDFQTNNHNSIKNIRTFYIEDYILVTRCKIAGKYRHSIGNFLSNIGAINRGRNKHFKLFSIPNETHALQPFDNESLPVDLYYPIKQYINRLFFRDAYRIEKFSVVSKFKIKK